MRHPILTLKQVGAVLSALLLATGLPAAAQENEPDDRSEGAPTGDPGERVRSGPPGIAPTGTPNVVERRNQIIQKDHNVLVLLAHPDDEIPFAPVLSRMARAGSTVTVVFATSGDVGPGVSGMEPGAELAELRESEGRCAAFALQPPDPIFWQLGDGELATLARNPDSAARDMEERTTALLDLIKPSVVLTWGPDGGYGHADHRMISAVATQVIQRMGEDRPDLLYLALPADVDAVLPGYDSWARVAPDLITDRIRYEMYDIEATRLAMDCYQSQFDAETRAMVPSLLHRDVWQGKVSFRTAFP